MPGIVNSCLKIGTVNSELLPILEHKFFRLMYNINV
nr:MAG TPA: hypothetical protein [Caudoviricetes sp.]